MSGTHLTRALAALSEAQDALTRAQADVPDDRELAAIRDIVSKTLHWLTQRQQQQLDLLAHLAKGH